MQKIKPHTNTLFRGDNLEIMKLMPDEFVDLCYIDPPFFTQKDYKNIWGDRESVFDYSNPKNSNGFSDRKDYFERNVKSEALGLGAYLEWMRYRIEEIHRILKPTGSFYLHLDYHAIHYIKVICDEIFGYKNFINEIVWQRKLTVNSAGKARTWSNNHDIILFYVKNKSIGSEAYYFEPQFIEDSHDLPDSIKNAYKKDDNDGRGLYQLVSMEAISDSPSLKFKFHGFDPPKRGWKWNLKRMNEEYKKGNIFIPEDKDKRVREKLFLSTRKGKAVTNLWTDIPCVQGGSKEYIGWPTQKPVALLERVINASSKEGDMIFDCFAGCGTSIHAAHNLKRQWIGIDVSSTAVNVNKKRLEDLGAKVNIIDEKALIKNKSQSKVS